MKSDMVKTVLTRKEHYNWVNVLYIILMLFSPFVCIIFFIKNILLNFFTKKNEDQRMSLFLHLLKKYFLLWHYYQLLFNIFTLGHYILYLYSLKIYQKKVFYCMIAFNILYIHLLSSFWVLNNVFLYSLCAKWFSVIIFFTNFFKFFNYKFKNLVIY